MQDFIPCLRTRAKDCNRNRPRGAACGNVMLRTAKRRGGAWGPSFIQQPLIFNRTLISAARFKLEEKPRNTAENALLAHTCGVKPLIG
jgi:hypothetical protein